MFGSEQEGKLEQKYTQLFLQKLNTFKKNPRFLLAVPEHLNMCYHSRELKRKNKDGVLKLLWRQINNPLIWVLIGSSTLAIALGKIIDGMVVLA